MSNLETFLPLYAATFTALLLWTLAVTALTAGFVWFWKRFADWRWPLEEER